MGALAADAPLGQHATALEVVPRLLERLDERRIAATFFVEGLNAEIYPDLLREIDTRGHEVAYHAWRHEQWADLTAAEQAANLDQGIAAFERIGLEIAGLRPPGGQLARAAPGSCARRACATAPRPAPGPASRTASPCCPSSGATSTPAACCRPSPPRASRSTAQATRSSQPTFVAWLEAEIGRLAESGGYMAIVLHPFMLDWLGDERLAALLDRVARASAQGEAWVARCAEVAEYVGGHPESFGNGAAIDSASWT